MQVRLKANDQEEIEESLGRTKSDLIDESAISVF